MTSQPPKNKSPVLVAAAILVDSGGRVLLAKRPRGKAMAGLWEFPGGKVRRGEGLKTALIRELSEELGIVLEARDLAPALTVCHDYPDFRLEMPVFLSRRWRGDPKPLEDQALAWVSPEKLETYPMPPADRPLIDKMPEILKAF